MKNKSLAFQIWIVFGGITLGILLFLAIFFSFTLRRFFTNEVYDTIEAAQIRNISKIVGKKVNREIHNELSNEIDELQDMRGVTHIKYPDKNIVNRLKVSKLLRSTNEAQAFWNEIMMQAKSQTSQSKRYSKEIKGKTMFYVIYKINVKGKDHFLLSYMWDTYRNNLTNNLFSKFMVIILIAIFISLVAALRIAKYLTRPLKKLQSNVGKIAERDWYEPVVLDREDEIGKLSYSIENMRKQLVKRDEAQQWMLQNISHELKTPVMVIRSYAQSVEDGIYPKGDLNSTMQVIDSEAERLQNRIRDLLYLTKLEYMAKHEEPDELIDIKNLVENVVERFRYKNDKLDWKVELNEAKILGKSDQWKVVIENLLDNSMRYAKEKVAIALENKGKEVLIRLHNDGEPIDEKMLPTLFNQFQKGKKGKFGLGLAIVKQIVEFHHGKVWATNEMEGVSFYIKVERST